MNKIEKQKVWLMVLGLGLIILSIVFLCGGVGLLIGGVKAVADTANNSASGVVMIVFGIILCVCFAPSIVLGIYMLWIGGYLSATKGSIKEGNIAKEGGTINMIKCDKCGTEIKAGDKVCSECGKPVEDVKKEVEPSNVEPEKVEPDKVEETDDKK